MSNLTEAKELVYERLAEIRRIKHEFSAKSRIDPLWEGIVGELSVEERFLVKLLDVLERT